MTMPNLYDLHVMLAGIMARQPGAALAVADDQRGRWITVGGTRGEDGKRHGGSPVFVQNGRITKGAPSLAGRRIDALQEEDESTHRQQLHREKGYSRAKAGKAAKAEGIDPADLHGLAAEILAHDREHSGDREEVLHRARELFRHYGYGAESLTTNLRSGRVEDDPHALDLVADSLARSYPHQFAGHEDFGERLLDLFREGKPRRMTEQEAYDQALEQLRERKREYDAEPAPFSVSLSTPSPVIPEIPDYLKSHKDPEQRAIEFEARSQGQLQSDNRPHARPKYTLAQGRALAAQLKAARQAQAAAAPPVQPPSPHEPIPGANVPTVLKQERQMVDQEREANGQQLLERVAARLGDLQKDTLFGAVDETVASDLDRVAPGLRPKDMSWSDWIDLVRRAWDFLDVDKGRGMERLGPSRLVEEAQVCMSLAGERRRPMTNARREQIVDEMMNAHRGGPPAQPPAAFSMGLYMMGVSGLTPERAAEIIEEMLPRKRGEGVR